MSLFKQIDRFYKLATGTPLLNQLKALRPQFAAAAQEVYDEWDASDEVDGDWQVGQGGICHLIADKILDVVASNIPDLNMTTISSSHEVHVYVVAGRTTIIDPEPPPVTEDEYYSIDIRPYIYETGGGYNWKKIPDVVFTPDDITIDWAEPLELDEDGNIREM